MDEQILLMSCKPSSTCSVEMISILGISLVFLFLLSVQTALCPDEQYGACSKIINCGRGPNISYPFWIEGRQESYCGFRGFQLTCKNGQPTYILSTADYVIRDITYPNRSLRVIDAETSINGSCSLPVQNITQEGTRFSYGPKHSDLYLFINCIYSSLHSEYLDHVINCKSVSFIALLADDPMLNQVKASGYCDKLVISPVDKNTSGASMESGNPYYIDMLNEGFDILTWKVTDCSTCQGSSGRCGFNWTSYNFVCLCPDRPHLKHYRNCLFISSLFSVLFLKFHSTFDFFLLAKIGEI
ncbi:hypothetical protein NE237_030564 [Protea cynaroides]|uniref:Uncharacterized protein n=1 Tax=Protea cynaroides TaxID=273540 RepID=A0A9Q0JW67_9MAGN|nr:hypothetical protein NE237_030564 [Protea cynaroides]